MVGGVNGVLSAKESVVCVGFLIKVLVAEPSSVVAYDSRIKATENPDRYVNLINILK